MTTMTQEHARALLCAAVTLADAVASNAPRDFLEVAVRDTWAAACDAAGVHDPEQLPLDLYHWGPTLDYDTRDRLAARWGQPRAERT